MNVTDSDYCKCLFSLLLVFFRVNLLMLSIYLVWKSIDKLAVNIIVNKVFFSGIIEFLFMLNLTSHKHLSVSLSFLIVTLI